ncbi:NLR family CARD domain-containing protein 4 [Holothuria leucospilota]|uniref:NLR family CARD domain-containing protein 4 n=1 Tax=Holothuria leucospilota TaxID=206669 RepID=A0A9Q1HKU8_HOLLE|nr:NLR family CARD domain-containing protein 4 [Holothuria leucospilota]
MDSTFFLLYLLVWVSCLTGVSVRICESPQYMALGKSGTIECSFQEGFHLVAWYNSLDLTEGKTILQMVDGVKDGHGYNSGQYDVCKNGSLIINNVTISHEQNLTVAMLYSQNEDPVLQQVEVIVTVMPSIPFPIVDQCEDKNTICHRQLPRDSNLTCLVQNARPAVFLRWVDRTTGRDRNVSFQTSYSENEASFTTSTTITVAFRYSSVLSLLTCRAAALPGLLLKQQTTILIENSNATFADLVPMVHHIERGSLLTLQCSKSDLSLVLWKKAGQKSGMFQVLAYAAFLEEDVPVLNNEQYQLQKDGSLVLSETEANHEGFYGCVFEYDGTGDAVLYQVIVFVTTVPIVHGCKEDNYCVLEGKTDGSLTCSLKGIRPKVLLELKTFHDRDGPLISFANQRLDVTSNGDVYDITLTSTYHLKETKKDRVTLECRISKSNIQALQSATKFDVIFVSVTEAPVAPIRSFPLWMLAVLIPVCLLLIFVCFFFIQRGRRWLENRERKANDLEEEVPMVSPAEENIQSVQKITLLKELKTKYKDQYDAVQPIPYIRDRLYCVDRVFVEGGFEKLISQGRIEGYGNWEKLNSYHEVMNLRSSSTRTIIEGDPGYGKSTLTLQLAYDWCNRTTESPLANVGIFILLRLRQLGGVQSVFKAIKQFILPRDSTLEETDIATVMYESKSTVIILDGYDEYPEEETSKLTDIISIIRREMFQDNLVILTTRSSLLPKSFPPNTQRIRLTGFDEKARAAYIRKAIVGENDEAARKIKRGLHNNPVLQGLCQVPLFFVMFAHMTHESETFLKFNSVTSFFRYMINCFHSHLTNKQKDPNVNQFTLLENDNDHDILDEIAFEGLSGKNQKIVWEKRELTERLGRKFYNHYKRIGILVEEEVLDLAGTPGNIQYKVEVRFYHKLFCEWYAAHCLSRKAVQPEVNLNELLKHMNPFDLQYTYRFACGLNSDAGDKIIEYLRGIKDGDKFAVLCILEQSGKIDQIKDTIRDMCSNYNVIDNNDSLLLQGSIVQLLEIGAGNQMPISFVWLKNCFNSVDASTGSILLKSELLFPVLATVEELAIGEKGRNVGNNEVFNILDYALMCTNLKTLRFCHCMLPQAIKAKSLSSLQSRNVQVLWITDDDEYCLNLRSGKWEKINGDDLDKIQDGNIQAKKNLLISLTRQFYEKLTSTIKPVPTDQQNVYPVNEVFVDGGIEGLTYTDDNGGGEWEEIASYQIIFSDSRFVAKRRLIEGKAGFGKSTLALKMASDWCSSNIKPPLSNIELFLLIRLRQEGLSKHIYAHLNHDALPNDSPLSGHDIKQVLRNCTSVLIVLDDVNFCLDQSNDTKCDIAEIVQGKMFSKLDVIMMSTSVPKECSRETKHLRLTGFHDKRRVEYIQKVFGDDNTLTADEVKLTLRENSMMNYFCKIPFFFVLLAHKIHETKQLETFSEESDLSKCILGCFHCHFVLQMGDNNTLDFSTLKKINQAFGKFAFEGLCSSNHGLKWSKDDMIDSIGQLYYDYYVQMGILVEHEICDDFEGDSKVRKTISQVMIQFYDNEFVYWYAAYYIAKGNVDWFSASVKSAVESSSYLKTLHQSAENRIEFAMLWINDQGPYVSGVLDVVKKLCSSEVEFNNKQKEVFKRSMLRILEIASDNKVRSNFKITTN